MMRGAVPDSDPQVGHRSAQFRLCQRKHDMIDIGTRRRTAARRSTSTPAAPAHAAHLLSRRDRPTPSSVFARQSLYVPQFSAGSLTTRTDQALPVRASVGHQYISIVMYIRSHRARNMSLLSLRTVLGPSPLFFFCPQCSAVLTWYLVKT